MSAFHLTYSGLGALCALLVLLVLPFLRHIQRRHNQPFIFYSQVADLPATSLSSWRKQAMQWTERLFLLSIIFFAGALPNLIFFLPATTSLSGEKMIKTPLEGTALYFIVDISGSMRRTVPYEDGFIPKIDLMKTLTEHFILGDQQSGLPGRPSDLLGLVSFARQANILAPLTLDHQAVIDKLKALQVVKDEADDGTSIGYAIYKTASTIAATRHYGEQLPHHEKPSYTILSTAMILVTDGFQSPSDLDKGNWLRTMGMEDAARYAKSQGIKLYIVNIEPSLNQPEFEPHRHLLERVAETTGGKFFLVDTLDSLPGIYREIDGLEKNVLPIEGLVRMENGMPVGPYRAFSLFPLLVVLGMGCLAGAIILETRVVRVVP